MKKSIILTIMLISLTIVISVILYPTLPDLLATHWDADGGVNGTMSKALGLSIVPALNILIIVFLLGLSKADPILKKSKKIDFGPFILALTLFMSSIQVLIIFWNQGYLFDMTSMIIIPLSVFMFMVGHFIKDVPRNWFVGIRTPWTISSEDIWEKTHKLGSILFRVSAAVMLFGILLPDLALYFLLLPILLSALGSVVYSYVIFRKN